MDVGSNCDILVLGGTGMLGHKMYQVLRQRFPRTYCAVRAGASDPALREIDLYSSFGVLHGFDAMDVTGVERALLELRPAVVVNCIGVIKHRDEAADALRSITVNSLFPHQLARLCSGWNGRLIHFSTDCVFSGDTGGYREDDFADARDLYGRTKFLGEVAGPRCLTLRTSIIGRELFHGASLLEWFLSQNHRKANGFTRAFYSGVTTNWLSEVVGDLIERHAGLSGLYQVTSRTITKFDLLSLLREAYKLDVEIVRDDSFFCDRSMSGEKFIRATGYVCPPWEQLAAQLAADATPYEIWRTVNHEVL